MTHEASGQFGEAFAFPVELGKIREFAKCLRAESPIWLSEKAAREEGLSGVPMPPTFPISAAHWDPPPPPGRENLQLDLRFVLHGEQEFIFHGPPPTAGTKLLGRQRIADVFEKQGKRGGTMKFVVTETVFTDEQGRDVITARSTLIQTGQVVKREGQ